MGTYHNQTGSSLLEVLISLGILSVGILGMSSLQSASLRSNQNAYFRTQATIYSFDVVERMRANLQGVSDGNYHNNAGTIVAACTNTAGCSSANLASNDVAEWNAALVAAFPSGSGTVCLDSTPATVNCDNTGTMYVVRISWDENRDGTASENFVMNFHP